MPILTNCDYCGCEIKRKPSDLKRRKRHFCSPECWVKFKQYLLPQKERPGFNPNISKEDREKRLKARSLANWHKKNGNIKREDCEVCGDPMSEIHHPDYDNPLLICWLCHKHHMQLHKEERQKAGEGLSNTNSAKRLRGLRNEQNRA